MTNQETWNAFKILGMQVRGETGKKPIAEADFVEQRRFGNGVITVVTFGALPAEIRTVAESLFDLYEDAVKRQDAKAIKTASRLFTERIGYSAETIFRFVHPDH